MYNVKRKNLEMDPCQTIKRMSRSSSQSEDFESKSNQEQLRDFLSI